MYAADIRRAAAVSIGKVLRARNPRTRLLGFGRL